MVGSDGGHGHGDGHGQHPQQQLTYDQVMADPVLRERLYKQKLQQNRMRVAVQIFALAVCFLFFWFYGRAIDEYLDPPSDHHAAVQARLRSAHSADGEETTDNQVASVVPCGVVAFKASPFKRPTNVDVN